MAEEKERRPASTPIDDASGRGPLLSVLNAVKSFGRHRIASPLLRVSEVDRRMELHKSTVSRILAAAQVDLVEREENSGWFHHASASASSACGPRTFLDDFQCQAAAPASRRVGFVAPRTRTVHNECRTKQTQAIVQSRCWGTGYACRVLLRHSCETFRKRMATHKRVG